jgi:predicted metal-dependent hydrolase
MSDFPIDVIRSKNRVKTVQGAVKDGRLEVRVPYGMDPDEEARLVREMSAKVTRRLSSRGVDLKRRANELADRYGLSKPRGVEWSSRQMRRWGSCSADQGTIRISERLAAMPGWVLDSVIVHELAHLDEPNHGARFEELVDRYELAERATGYLIAVSEGRAR